MGVAKKTGKSLKTRILEAGDYLKEKWDDFTNSTYVTAVSKKTSEVREAISFRSRKAAYIVGNVYRDPWSEITDGLLLGGMPINTSLLGFGNQPKKIIRQCKSKKLPLEKVYSVVEESELKGKGLMGLDVANAFFWKKESVDHQLVPMKANSGKLLHKTKQASVVEIAKIVNEMNSLISTKKSVLVHDDAGQSRALVLVACYLLKHNSKIKSTTDALAFIYKKRPQVAVSMAELELIEEYRKANAKDKAGLNMDSRKFEPFRSSWTKTFKLNNPLVQYAIFEGAYWLMGGGTKVDSYFGGLFTLEKTSTFLEGLYARVPAMAAIGLSHIGLKVRDNIGEEAYKNLGKQYETFSEKQKLAVGEGVRSKEGLKKWLKSNKELSTLTSYPSYLAGRRAKEEADPICTKALTEMRRIRAK